MAQFRVYRNPRSSKRDVPFLLDVQSDFVKTPSRVVVPLVREEKYGLLYGRLNPVFTIDKIKVVASFSDLAAIPSSELKQAVGDLSGQHAELVASLDFLFSGF